MPSKAQKSSIPLFIQIEALYYKRVPVQGDFCPGAWHNLGCNLHGEVFVQRGKG
jgi:hypothetical protein